MKPKKYLLGVGSLAFILLPLIVGFLMIVTPSWPIEIANIFLPTTIVALVCFLCLRRWLPESGALLFLPTFAAFCYYMSVWIIIFGLSNYRFNSNLFSSAYYLLSLPYFFGNIVFSFMGDYGFFPILNAFIAISSVLAIILIQKISKKRIIYDKKVAIYIAISIALSGIAAYQHYDRSTIFLSQDFQVDRIEDEVNLYIYKPFREYSPENTDKSAAKVTSIYNRLQRLPEPATIAISENYPKLDGATAAYPVFAAMAQEIYKGLNEFTAEKYVTCSNTSGAYEHLINGAIDIFFGAQPSKQQMEAAQAKGVEFVLTPIGKEAFVFFVNKDNPIDSLTLAQIQDIYQKKITNWQDLGGINEQIMPFQRPENSGSQTIMLAAVMRDKKLPTPLWEEYAAGMGGVISKVATYRNYSSAIGYSFRYFATGMKPNENIKLVAINGVEPTVENIRNGSYPFVVDVYAVTAGSTNENTEKLIQWILSEQGQSFIETCGYVRR